MASLDDIVVVAAFCRDLGISRPTYYAWKKDGIPKKRCLEYANLIDIYIKELAKIKADIEKDIPTNNLEWL